MFTKPGIKVTEFVLHKVKIQHGKINTTNIAVKLQLIVSIFSECSLYAIAVSSVICHL